MEDSICKRCEYARICGKAILDNKNVIMSGCSRFKECKPVEYKHLRLDGNIVHLPLSEKQLDDAIDLYERMRHPRTNRDRSLAMTDEELAEFMSDDLCEVLECPVCDGHCDEKLVKWLKEEMKE